jgi:TIR domain
MINVFLSWSGESSKSAAQVLRGWLPTVIQSVHPYMSAEDIDKGERWSIDIARQLEETNFGIICMTPENISAPWVLFEAGALSKSMERSRVSPLLFSLNPSDFSKSPLLQFQLTTFNKDEVFKLLQSINNASSERDRLRKDVLKITFERSWVDLSEQIGKIDFNRVISIPPTTTSSDKMAEILEELLSNSRAQLKILHSPQELFPIRYVQAILGLSPRIHDRLLLRLRFAIHRLAPLVNEIPEEEKRKNAERLLHRLWDEFIDVRSILFPEPEKLEGLSSDQLEISLRPPAQD